MMSLDQELARVPIQNLIAVSNLMPKLRSIGVRNVQDAHTLLDDPSDASSALTSADIKAINSAVTQLQKELEFCKSFKWELLAYSSDVQAEFSSFAPKVFDKAFIQARLIYLSIPTRTLRALENAQLETVGEVLDAQNQLLSMRNLGERSIGELFRIIGQFARVYRYMLGNLWNATERRLTPPKLVRAIIAPLNERERDVIQKRYGLEGDEMTLRETGEALGISRERARQIQNRTMEKLREGTSLALLHDWIELQLPHLVFRAMVRSGGIATTTTLCSRISGSGFNLNLVADILKLDLHKLLEDQGLIRMNDDLWALNPALAHLAQDARKSFVSLGTSQITPDEEALDNARDHFSSNHPIGKKYPPSHHFLRAVHKHLPHFSE